jgi:hypothetical protein
LAARQTLLTLVDRVAGMVLAVAAAAQTTVLVLPVTVEAALPVFALWSIKNDQLRNH